MTKSRFKWHFTFRLSAVDVITIEEDHPEINMIKTAGILDSATLVDMDRFCSLDEESRQIESIIHSISLPEGSRLGRVFRRIELALFGGHKRTIPAFSYIEESAEKYCFAFHDKVFLTTDPRFHRIEWETDD